MISSQQGQSGLFMLLRYNSTSLTSLTSSFETSVTISQSTRPYITENFYLYPAVRISSFACILSLTAHPITYIIFHRINHIIYLRQRQPPGRQRKICFSCPHHHYPTPRHHLQPPSLNVLNRLFLHVVHRSDKLLAATDNRTVYLPRTSLNIH